MMVIDCSTPAASMLTAQLRDEEASGEDEEALPELATASVEQGAISQTYSIERKCTIESDNKPHKVLHFHTHLTQHTHIFSNQRIWL
jgi:hypothetical protein